jgi:LacI family transcriptional regulator
VTRIKDIADLAGVSIGTVDRIIHSRGRYSPYTAERVRRIMAELDYRPNLMAQRLSMAKACRIGVFMPRPEQDSGYWRLALDGINRAARDLAPFGLCLETIHYDRYDASGFMRAGLGLVAEKFDGILMAPLLTEESQKLLAMLGQNAPVLFFDTDLPSTPRLSFIGQDSHAGGRLAGRLMNLLTAGQGSTAEAVLLMPDADNEHLRQRASGFIELFQGSTRSLRIAVESNHDLPALHAALGAAITPNTAALYVIDASAHYSAEYLRLRAGSDGFKRQRPSLIGYDLVPENRLCLEAGEIDFLLTQRPDEQGYHGVNRLFRKLILDENPPDCIFTPIDIVTRENVAYLPAAQR